jgi:hypothetical protein
MALEDSYRRGFNTGQRFRAAGHCPLGDIWTEREAAIVRRHYPDYIKIRRLLPHRSRQALRGFAHRYNIARKSHVWTLENVHRVRKLAQAGLNRIEIYRLTKFPRASTAEAIKRHGITIRRRPPAPAKCPLVHAIRQRAFQLNMTMTDLRQEVGNKFRPAVSVTARTIRKTVRLLDGKLIEDKKGARIVWND